MKQEDPSVLVIDDDAEIRYSIDRVLTNLGTRVTAADSGETGIENARAVNPHIIFLDNRIGGICLFYTSDAADDHLPDDLHWCRNTLNIKKTRHLYETHVSYVKQWR